MKAALTGSALRTPLAGDPKTLLARLVAGECAAESNLPLVAEQSACKILATIPGRPACTSHSRFLSRLELFAIDVGLEAFAGRSADGERLGLFTATGGLRVRWEELEPALAAQVPSAEASWERGLRRLHPYWLLQHLSNNVHALLSADLGARGEGATFGGSNSGAQAIAAALRALESRSIDVAVVVSCDALTTPTALLEGAARGVFTKRLLDALAAPYQEDADGAFPGEAVAAVVLERIDEVRAPPLAYVSAFATGDGQPGFPEGSSLVAALRRFVPEAAREKFVVDGAGRGRHGLDLEERMALASALGADVPLTCTGAATGQLGASSALVQVITLGHMLGGEVLPPIAGLRRAANGPLDVLRLPRSHGASSALGIGLSAPGLIGLVQVDKP